MKKPLLIILTLALSSAFAQIPNAGFETTTTMTGFCNTGGATITTPTYYISSPNTNGVTNVAHSGTKAAMIATFSGQASSVVTMDCGTFMPYAPYTGFVPGSMTLWVRRAAPMSNDTLTITVASYDNAQNPLTAGQLQLTGAGYSAYTQLTIPMSTFGTGASAQIEVAFTGCVVANSSWYVDDLAFQPVGIANYDAANFSMFYNSDANSIEVKATKANETMLSVCVYDVLGKKLIETPTMQLQNGNPLSVSTQGFQPGIYMVQLQNKEGVITTRRIFIQ